MLAQLGGQPGINRVAVGAISAKDALVNFRFGVAGYTFARGALEHLIHMAGGAFGHSVPPSQWPNVGMVKISHAVQTIVAILAAWAKEGGVFNHEGGNGRCMASFTRRIRHGNGVLTCVAMGAGKFTAVKICDVAGEAKTGGALMVKWGIVKRGGLPGNRAVAAAAIRAKHRLVLFRLGVAGHTFLWRTLKFTARVAAFAARGFVRAGQGKLLGVLGHRKVRHSV